MKNIKAIFIAGFFVALAGVLPRAQAASGAECVILPSDIAAIQAVHNDPSLNTNAQIQQELALRKQLVGKAVNCAKSDAMDLQTALQAVPTTSDLQSFKDQAGDKFNDAFNFYDIELSKLDNAGIAGTQAIAAEVLAWREGSYASLSSEVNNFILWSKNQALFRTAQSRMNQTQRAVNFIESAASNAELQSAFSDAQSSFTTAQSANDAARTALLRFSSPDQSAASLKQSLQSLSDMYQKLFNVSTLITKLLPQ